MDEQPKAQASTQATPGTETQPAPKTQTPAQSDDGSTEAGADASGEATADWRKVLDEVDTKELRTHPKLAGLIGELAKRQADEMARERDKQAQQRQVQDELRQLRRKDPVGYAERMEQVEAEQTANGQRDQQLWGMFLTTMKPRFDGLPEEARTKMLGKKYDGMTLVEAQKSFVEDLMDAEKAELTPKEKLDEARKEAVEAGKAEARTEAASSRKNPDLSAGTAQKSLDQGEWDRHRSDSDWRRANSERINKAITSGAIRR